MALRPRPRPRTARGESEGGGGGAAASVEVPTRRGRQRAARRSPPRLGPGPSASPRAAVRPWASHSPREPGTAGALRAPRPGPLTLAAQPQGDRPGWLPLPGGLRPYPQVLGGYPTLPKARGHARAPPALWRAARGTGGAPATVTHTKKNWDPRQAGGGGGGRRGRWTTRRPRAHRTWHSGGEAASGAAPTGPLAQLPLGGDGVGSQLLRAIVSTTCSSLLRSRCRRACSSFSRAVRISSLYLVM